MGYKAILATAATAAVMGTGSFAAKVTIDQIDAAWDDMSIVGGAGTAQVINTMSPLASVRWGDPSNPDDLQSGYDFLPVAPLGFELLPDTPQILGTFTHINNVIAGGTSITAISLDFTFGGTVIEDAAGNTVNPPIPAQFDATFNFLHNETPNLNDIDDCDPQISMVACDDIVTVQAVDGDLQVVTIDDSEYTFRLLGFGVDDGQGNITFSKEFITAEGGTSSAQLYFDYSARVVPLPAAGWLLLAGIGALGAAGRRRKKSA